MYIDPNSETWRSIMMWADQKGENSLKVTARKDVPEREADFHRGRFSIIQELTQLPGFDNA